MSAQQEIEQMRLENLVDAAAVIGSGQRRKLMGLEVGEVVRVIDDEIARIRLKQQEAA